MSTTADSTGSTTADDQVSSDDTFRVNEVMQRLDAWKTRIDEIRVQVDLAKLDLREEAEKQLELARNVNHVAASKLRVAYEDAVGSADTLRQGLHEFLHDVDEAFDAVQAVISRG
jgi:dsDNA-specific endonuclease/ATPase MutS2